jgi:uridylate kinase
MINKLNSLNGKTYVFSLGGSLIFPKTGIDIKFLINFREFVKKKVAQGCHFFIVTGGGAAARQYIDVASKIVGHQITNDDLDWLGIHATRYNAHLLRTIFRDLAYIRVIDNYDVIDKQATEYKVVVAAGWKPGWSTDYCTALLAQDYGIKTVVNLSTIKMVYNKDPIKYKDAKPIERLNWDELLKLTGDQFIPGMHAPFDPVAARLAKEAGLRVVICNGHNFKNLDNILEGREFVGTVIE